MSTSGFSLNRDSAVNNQVVEKNLVARKQTVAKAVDVNDLTIHNSLKYPNAVTEVGDVLVAVDTEGSMAWAAADSIAGVVDGTGTANALTKWSDGAAGTLADSNVTDSGSLITLGVHTNMPDSQQLRLGTENYLTLEHNGTDSIISSMTGNLMVLNQDVLGFTQFILGTSTSHTAMEVRNDANALLTVNGAGDVSVGVVDVPQTEAANAVTITRRQAVINTSVLTNVAETSYVIVVTATGLVTSDSLIIATMEYDTDANNGIPYVSVANVGTVANQFELIVTNVGTVALNDAGKIHVWILS